MSRKLILTFFLLLTMVSSISCWDIQEIEQTSFISYIAIDQNPVPETYTYSFNYPTLKEEAPEPVNNMTTEAHSLQTARSSIQRRTQNWVSLGMLRTLIFSKPVAEEGIFQHLDLLSRNPRIPGRVKLAITDDEIEKIAETEVAATEDYGEYLETLFKTGDRRILLPHKTLKQFLIELKTTGIETTIPIIELGETDTNIIGKAIFKGDEMVGKINPEESRMLLLLTESNPTGMINLKAEKHSSSYYIQQVDVEIKPQKLESRFQFNITLDVAGYLTEDTREQNLIEDIAPIKSLEKQLATKLEEEIQNLFITLQLKQSDAVGVGKIVQSTQPENFSPETWPQEFAQAQIKPEVTVQIRQLGTAN